MANNVKMVFDNKMHGIITGHHGSSQVGPSEGALAAYDMVLGGLGACLNHTFQSVLDKKQVKIHGVNYDITGVKREEVPATLKEVTVKATISGVENDTKDKVEKAFELATKYCSVYQTISHVADMQYSVEFK